MTPDDLTHAGLVKRAGRWLLNTKRCKLVVVNAAPVSCIEHPDAIGWLSNGESIVVECKVSRADFWADHRKMWRKMSVGLGFYRYFLTPPGLELGPMLGGWRDDGLLEMRGSRVKVLREAAARQVRDHAAEISLLVSRLSGGRVLLNGKRESETEKDGAE